jgi:hypothetical protein
VIGSAAVRTVNIVRIIPLNNNQGLGVYSEVGTEFTYKIKVNFKLKSFGLKHMYEKSGVRKQRIL